MLNSGLKKDTSETDKGAEEMKRSDSIKDIISEFDFDSFADEMDILFGDRFGAASVINNHITTNKTRYSEATFTPQMVENEDEVREANEIGHLLADHSKAKNGKIKIEN